MTEFLKIVYYWLMTGIASVISFIFYPCRVRGQENIPIRGGVIYASNHESNIDPILIPVASPRRIRFMAKDSLFKNPVLAAIIRWGGGFPVKRSSADRGAIKEFLKQLKKGYPVLIFPQGTRGGEKVQAGVGFLATMSGAPVVPIFINGTDRVLPKGSKFPKRTQVSLTFGVPIRFEKNIDHQHASQQIMEAINALRC